MSSSRNNYNSMTEIHTLSAADFKHTMQKNDLYDSNIDMRTDLADDIFANGPSSHWFKRSHKNVLNLDFDDIAAPEEWGSLSKCNQYILFDDDMARQIASACFLIMPEKKILDIMEKVYQEQKIKRDSLFEEAVGIISKQKTCKPAILQNRLAVAVGYQRACQILEQMESDGIVGPESKTGERKVLMKKHEKFKEKGL